jgi:hypothetical protein
VNIENIVEQFANLYNDAYIAYKLQVEAICSITAVPNEVTAV